MAYKTTHFSFPCKVSIPSSLCEDVQYSGKASAETLSSGSEVTVQYKTNFWNCNPQYRSGLFIDEPAACKVEGITPYTIRAWNWSIIH